MSKFKNWVKENGLYVLGGLATAGVMAAAVIKGLKPGDSTSNFLTIDISKDDWMDLKELDSRWSYKGKKLTIRQALCDGMFCNYIVEKTMERGLLPDPVRIEICEQFAKEHEDKFNVLNTIEGFVEYTKTEE